ncbi:MAG: hypothetical protein GX558_12230 [Clostridiales bacterium]|nr:hypothetical protein [Clostridiales bacterium]
MAKFIPREKQSKKQRRADDRKKRATWGAINPVTRRPENPKAYCRAKARRACDGPTGLSLACH